MSVLLAQSKNGGRINSIFGEDVKPRIRKIRSSPTIYGFPAEDVIEHGTPRIAYAVPLASKFGAILMGKAVRPNNFFPQGGPEEATSAIVEFWRKRWLGQRIKKKQVLDEVRKHILVRPVKHGARVVLPSLEEEELLFAALPNDSCPKPERRAQILCMCENVMSSRKKT